MESGIGVGGRSREGERADRAEGGEAIRSQLFISPMGSRVDGRNGRSFPEMRAAVSIAPTRVTLHGMGIDSREKQ